MNELDTLLKKLKFLVVDDMSSIQGMVKSCLIDLGAEHIELCSNGSEAWKKLQSTHIDLVVCDWDMPKMTGIDLLRNVRANDNLKDLPFLLLTATTEKTLVKQAIELGVNEYLTKPFQPKELEFRVIKMLTKLLNKRVLL